MCSVWISSYARYQVLPIRPEFQKIIALFFRGVMLFHPAVGDLRSISHRQYSERRSLTRGKYRSMALRKR